MVTTISNNGVISLAMIAIVITKMSLMYLFLTWSMSYLVCPQEMQEKKNMDCKIQSNCFRTILGHKENFS